MGENEVTVQYPDDGTYSSLMPNRVPLRALKFAEVPRFRGKSRAWNQLVSLDLVATSSMSGATVNTSTQTASGTVTNADGTFYLNMSNATNFDIVSGHKYLFVIPISAPSALTAIKAYISNSIVTDVAIEITLSISNGYAIGIVTASATKSVQCLCIYSYTTSSAVSGQTITITKPIIRDLSLIFPEGVPSTIAECVQKCPDLLKYDAYDAGSLVDTIVSGVKTVGFNICTEDWELGTISDITGETESNQTGAYWRINRYFPVIAGKPYYAKTADGYSSSNSGVAYFFYDSNKSYIGVMANRGDIVTSIPNGCAYVRLVHFFLVPRAEAPEKVSLNKSQPNTSIFPHNGDYLPFKSYTLSLPETVTLRGVGTCIETYDPETGELDDGKFAIANLDEWDAYYDQGFGCWVFYKAGGDSGKFLGNNVTPNMMITTGQQPVPYYGDKSNGISISDTGFLLIGNGDSTTKPSGIVIYEKATYTPSSPITPVPDNFLAVEGGGTVETIQTQTPVIDNCLDVTYDIIPQ